MTNTLIPEPDIQKLIAAVAKEIEQGTARIQQAYQAEVLRTSWNIGRVICETVTFDEGRTLHNGAIINRLVEQFKRPDTFFYNVIKFYRLYPVLPRTHLSWTHYQTLISVDNSSERKRLEQKAVRENLSVKDFRAYVSGNRAAPRLVDVAGAGKIKYTRGMLYHYRLMQEGPEQAENGRLLVDIGFSIERDVRDPLTKSLHTGLIVRAVKETKDFSVNIAPYSTDRLYTYQAFVKRVVDGDTLVLKIDLGFRTHVTHKIRLRAIDAPEITTKLGRQARIFVQELIGRNPKVVIKSYKDDKYGRYLVDVFVGPRGMDAEAIAREGVYLNQLLLDKGLAVLMK